MRRVKGSGFLKETTRMVASLMLWHGSRNVGWWDHQATLRLFDGQKLIRRVRAFWGLVGP